MVRTGPKVLQPRTSVRSPQRIGLTPEAGGLRPVRTTHSRAGSRLADSFEAVVLGEKSPNICSAQIKENQRVFNRFIQYGGRLHVSVVSVGELVIWALRDAAPSKRHQDVSDLLQLVMPRDVTMDIARRYGEVQASLLDVGLQAPDNGPLDRLDRLDPQSDPGHAQHGSFRQRPRPILRRLDGALSESSLSSRGLPGSSDHFGGGGGRMRAMAIRPISWPSMITGIVSLDARIRRSR